MTHTPRNYKGWWIFATAIAIVLFQNLPAFLNQPDVAFAQNVWVMGQQTGWREVWISGIARDHGLTAALRTQTAVASIIQLILALVAATFFWWMCRRNNSVKLWRMSWVACAAVVTFSAVFFAIQVPRIFQSMQADSRIYLPIDLAAWLNEHPGNFYANPTALPLIQPLTPNAKWLPIAEAHAVVSDPVKWRQLDQTKSFDAVLLNGRLSEYAPLLQHFLTSPDWSLAFVDNFGIVFTRGAKPWEPPAADELAKRFANPRDAALYLSQTALTLSIAGKNGEAIRYFEAAEKLAPAEAEIFARKAVFFNSRSRLGDAVAAADEALAINPDLLSAVQIKALAQLSAQQPETAWKTAMRLPELAPEDPYSLFIYARCANAVHAYSAETDTLEKVIALSQKQGMRVTNYQIFLGQAYAHRGLSKQAMDQLKQASLDPANTPEQKKEIEQTVALIQAQIGEGVKN